MLTLENVMRSFQNIVDCPNLTIFTIQESNSLKQHPKHIYSEASLTECSRT